jgi:hypothetical protein
MIIRNQSKRLRTFTWCLVITIGLLASVTGAAAWRAPSSTITIVNNSGLEIRHVYLSPVNGDNWGADQLNDSAVIASGASFTINDVSCAQGSIKVIAEDQNGCFFYNTADCTANSTWAIGANATPDCGH